MCICVCVLVVVGRSSVNKMLHLHLVFIVLWHSLFHQFRQVCQTHGKESYVFFINDIGNLAIII